MIFNFKIYPFFLFAFVLILNPYTQFFKLSDLIVLPFFLYVFAKYFKCFDSRILYSGLILLFVSVIGVLSSLYHDIFQLEHLKVSVSIFIYLVVGSGLAMIFHKNHWGLNEFLLLVLLVVFLNSVVILIEIISPSFRAIIESLLAPSGNVNWSEGFRYRGLASGGGANLAILAPVSIVVALYLFQQKYISVFKLSIYVIVLIVALLFIGRTGVLLLPIPFLLYIFFYARKNIIKVSLFLITFFVLLWLISGTIKDFMISQYGYGFYEYAFGFFLRGSDGLKDEGTAGMIIDFLTVLPTTFPEVIIGYGFYGGSDFVPWTDSGYSRMFLSLGYPLGLLSYVTILYLAFKASRNVAYLITALLCILLISETKEPLLLTGYSARFFFVLVGFLLMKNKLKNRDQSY